MDELVAGRRRADKKEKKEERESRDKEEPSVAGGTRTGAKNRRKEEEEGRKGEGTARKKGEAAQGATKVAVTLRKASKSNERDQKGERTGGERPFGTMQKGMAECTKKKKKRGWLGEGEEEEKLPGM